MEIDFRSKKDKKLYESSKELSKKHGKEISKKIMKRINELSACSSLAEMKVGNPHPLKENRNNQFAVNLTGNRRLVFEPLDEYEIDNYLTIRKIKIIEVIDYH